MDIHTEVEAFVEDFAPSGVGRRRTTFINNLRKLLEHYGTAALAHGNLPDTTHPHVDDDVPHLTIRQDQKMSLMIHYRDVYGNPVMVPGAENRVVSLHDPSGIVRFEDGCVVPTGKLGTVLLKQDNGVPICRITVTPKEGVGHAHLSL